MEPLIEFCINNCLNGSQIVVDKLEKLKSLEVIATDCLGHCKMCSRKYFALVENVVVMGASPEELVQQIVIKIEELNK